MDETLNETLEESQCMDDEEYHKPNERRCTRVLSENEVLYSWKETDMHPEDPMNKPNIKEDLSDKIRNMTPEEVTEFINRLSHSEDSSSEEEETTKNLLEQKPQPKSGKNKVAALLNQQKKATGPKKNTKNIKLVSPIVESETESNMIEKAPEIKKQGKTKTKNPKPISPIKENEMESNPVEEEPEIKRLAKTKRGKKEKVNNANAVVDSTVYQNINNVTDSDKIISEEVDKSKKPKKGTRGKEIQATEKVTEEISQQNLGIEDELNKMKIESHLEDQENPKKNIKKSNAKENTAAQDSKEVKKTNSKTAKGKTTKKEVETREINVAQETNAVERTLRSTRGKPKQEPIDLKETNKSNENEPPSKVILNEDISTSGRGKKTTKKVTLKTEVQDENTESKTDEPNTKKKTNNSKQKNSGETTNKDDTLNKKNNPRSKAGVAKEDKTSEKKENDNKITEPVQAPKRATRKK